LSVSLPISMVPVSIGALSSNGWQSQVSNETPQ
jgi:hypothetical protein